MRVFVSVPATCANLGPGFDCFGLALELMNDVAVDTDGPPGIRWAGEGADELLADGSDLISVTMERVAHRFALTLPSVAMTAEDRIPLGRGLGSSSAAAVAGVVLASALLDLGVHDDPDSVFALASEIEGHPDNAAAAVYGGFTLAMPSGAVRRFDPHPDLRPVVLVPPAAVATADARAALPPAVAREDAVFNLAHAALAVEALTRDPSALGAALEDRMHQDVRLAMAAEVVPGIDGAVAALRRLRLPWCLSGAGPTILVFEPEAGTVTEEVLEVEGEGWRILRPGVRTGGFTVAVEPVAD
jgi:homoserine kinase